MTCASQTLKKGWEEGTNRNLCGVSFFGQWATAEPGLRGCKHTCACEKGV